MAAAGDVSGDGHDDLVVGDPDDPDSQELSRSLRPTGGQRLVRDHPRLGQLSSTPAGSHRELRGLVVRAVVGRRGRGASTPACSAWGRRRPGHRSATA
ncbi:FG-GAP repeat protein [Streptomyces sp. NPDC059374]|uniref:FG-GAP repeat protein n=1 Tax=Streptomyces sp. NPDC059374 TaxID=3346814 RepID=UPI00369716BD